MTLLELHKNCLEAYESLGFFVDDQDAILYALMRHTTPTRLRRAVQDVAEDSNYRTTLEKHNALVSRLQQSFRKQKAAV